MRFLVLGGTRFIGPPVVRRLLSMGHSVTVFHRGSSECEFPEKVRHIHGDLKAVTQYADLFVEFAPDAVLATMAFTQQDGQNLVKLFRGVTRRLVALSSIDVYRAYDRLRGAEPGPPDPTPLTEDSPLRARLFPFRDLAGSHDDFRYQYEKILMERAVAGEPQLPATILRLPMVYGPGDYQHRLFPYLKRMDDGRPAILLSKAAAGWRGARAYVEDVGAAVVRCLVDARSGSYTYNVAEQAALTEKEWVERIGAAAGWAGEVRLVADGRIPERLRETLDYSQDLTVDSTRVRRQVGYSEVTTAEQALQAAIDWERSNPPPDARPFDYEEEDAALAE